MLWSPTNCRNATIGAAHQGAPVERSPDPPDDSPAAQPPENPFDVSDATEAEFAEMQKANRRRIAIWGILTGAVMSLLVLICIGLLVAAQNA
jgi:hypothetical protein